MPLDGEGGLMKTYRLQGTGIDVSNVCLGTMTFGSQVSEAGAARMVDYAIDRGVNFFDTANVYNGGLSEEITGRILGPRRSRIILATKVRGIMGGGDDSYKGLSRTAIRRAVDESLRRLGTDYIDIYYMHMPDRSVPIEETLQMMNDLRAEGKIRWIGTSNYAAWQMAEMDSYMRRIDGAPPKVAQPMYNVLARGIEQEYIEFTDRYRVSNVCYNPLAGGLLSGKQSFDKGPIPGTRFDGNKMYMDRFWHAAYFRAVDTLKDLAAGLAISLTELALRWICNRNGVQSVIIGASKQKHLEENIDASQRGRLPDDVLDACDNVWAELRGPTPQYNR